MKRQFSKFRTHYLRWNSTSKLGSSEKLRFSQASNKCGNKKHNSLQENIWNELPLQNRADCGGIDILPLLEVQDNWVRGGQSRGSSATLKIIFLRYVTLSTPHARVAGSARYYSGAHLGHTELGECARFSYNGGGSRYRRIRLHQGEIYDILRWLAQFYDTLQLFLIVFS